MELGVTQSWPTVKLSQLLTLNIQPWSRVSSRVKNMSSWQHDQQFQNSYFKYEEDISSVAISWLETNNQFCKFIFKLIQSDVKEECDAIYLNISAILTHLSRQHMLSTTKKQAEATCFRQAHLIPQSNCQIISLNFLSVNTSGRWLVGVAQLLTRAQHWWTFLITEIIQRQQKRLQPFINV